MERGDLIIVRISISSIYIGHVANIIKWILEVKSLSMRSFWNFVLANKKVGYM